RSPAAPETPSGRPCNPSSTRSPQPTPPTASAIAATRHARVENALAATLTPGTATVRERVPPLAAQRRRGGGPAGTSIAIWARPTSACCAFARAPAQPNPPRPFFHRKIVTPSPPTTCAVFSLSVKRFCARAGAEKPLG